MKALVGRDNVRKWSGEVMHDALLQGVNQDHAEMGIVRKCRTMFEGFRCCRVRGHDGFHFSRTFDAVEDRLVVNVVWEA